MGSADVQRLFAQVPFDGVPPEYVRVLRYNYTFTDSAMRERTGNWWQREFSDNYQTPMRLSIRMEPQPGGPREIPWQLPPDED